MNIHEVTRDFEARICDYTGAPLCVTFDNASNALYSVLRYIGIKGKTIGCPKHTYISVPQMIREAGGEIEWIDNDPNLTGAYPLVGTNVWDSALRFTADMYIPGMFMVLSFTGAYKQLKLGKAGAVLFDDKAAETWLKRFRFNGRNECSYHVDLIEQEGYNFYLLPELAVRGHRDMDQFYNPDGSKKENKDITLKYPDQSLQPVFNR